MDRPGSLNEKFTNINKCDICYLSYNRSDKRPVIVCTMHHTICQQCMASLHSRPICPFCRQPIKMDKVVFNNYILQLLPDQGQQARPNSRMEVAPANHGRQFNHQPQAMAFQYYPNTHIANFNQDHQLYQSIPAATIMGAPYQELPHQIPERVQQVNPVQQNQVEPVEQSNCFAIIFFCLFFAQLIFTVLNLYFGATSPPSECMDVAHRSDLLTLRPWLNFIGTIQFVLLTATVILCCLRFYNCIGQSVFVLQAMALASIFVLKTLVWSIVQLLIFEATIYRHCSGAIYAYGVVLNFVHIGILLSLCGLCEMSCRRCSRGQTIM